MTDRSVWILLSKRGLALYSHFDPAKLLHEINNPGHGLNHAPVTFGDIILVEGDEMTRYTLEEFKGHFSKTP